MLYRRAGKRILDIVVAGSALLFLSPLLALTALAVALTIGRPLVFRQTRPGRHGRLVTVFKFRTMTDERLPEGGLLPDEDRLSPLGRWLRATSLDELPELVNVLKGEMSLVGPRPIVAAEVRRYGRHFVDYCSVRPGMTGIWQISGRNDIGYRRRVAMDCLMARRMSPRLYAEVLIGTARCVVTRQGAY